MPKWKDTSSYCQSDVERVPHAFEIAIGCFRLVVHRHIHYPPDQWLASCRPDIFERKELPAKDIETAKKQAIQLLLTQLDKAMRDLAEIQQPRSKREKKKKS